ncbi:MAG: rRNA adenine N-6-methyltransferase family protein, partial [Nitrospinota bacterium]
APKVESAVLRITPLPEPRVRVRDEGFFFRMVRATFAHRRKTLLNNLKHFLEPGMSQEALRELLALAGIDPGRRSETLCLHEFTRLSDILSKRLSKRGEP